MNKIKSILKISFAFLTIIFFASVTNRNAKNKLINYVDPFIGSGGHGHVFVGANVPFGGVQVGPTNFNKGWDWSSSYHYSDSIVKGFSAHIFSGNSIPCA